MAAYYGTGSGFPRADPSLQGITKSFGVGESGSFDSGNLLKSGSKMAFDPLSLGLGLGSSLISGLFGMGQAQTSASIAQANLAAQNQAILEGREQTKAALGSSMWNQLFQAGPGADIAFQREKAAKEWLQGPYAERQLGLQSEASKRERMARISPEAKEAARFENRLAIEREIAARRAQTDAMFGPVRGSYIG
jgi:hypothetical protein